MLILIFTTIKVNKLNIKTFLSHNHYAPSGNFRTGILISSKPLLRNVELQDLVDSKNL